MRSAETTLSKPQDDKPKPGNKYWHMSKLSDEEQSQLDLAKLAEAA